MHRRRKRELLSDNRFCTQCKRPSSTLLTILGSQAKYPLKTNIVDDELRCGHDFCDQCLQKLFDESPKRVFPCPSCASDVRQKQLKTETLTQIDALREREKRARVNKIRNRTAEYFNSRSEYENYIQETEEIVWKLVNFIDIKKTEESLDEYEKLYKSDIGICESNKLSQRLEERRKINEMIEMKRLLKIKNDLEDSGKLNESDLDTNDILISSQQQTNILSTVTLIQPKAKFSYQLKENIRKRSKSSKQSSQSHLSHFINAGKECPDLMNAGGFDFNETLSHYKFRMMTELKL